MLRVFTLFAVCWLPYDEVFCWHGWITRGVLERVLIKMIYFRASCRLELCGAKDGLITEKFQNECKKPMAHSQR